MALSGKSRGDDDGDLRRDRQGDLHRDLKKIEGRCKGPKKSEKRRQMGLSGASERAQKGLKRCIFKVISCTKSLLPGKGR